MKKILYLVCLFFSFVYSYTYAMNIFNDWSSNEVIYCQSWDNCSLNWWIDSIKNGGSQGGINGIVVDKKLSVYVQDIIVYLMSFVTLIAVIYIIYAWFKVMTAGWDDKAQESAKKTKKYRNISQSTLVARNLKPVGIGAREELARK